MITNYSIEQLQFVKRLFERIIEGPWMSNEEFNLAVQLSHEFIKSVEKEVREELQRIELQKKKSA